MRLTALWAGLFCLLAATQANAAETVKITDARGTTTLNAQLFVPDGEGPFPALVLLHGCAGIKDHHHRWAERFADWGYVSLLIDSLGPREIEETCDNPMNLPPSVRQLDALGGLKYLRTLASVDGQRVALVGWSHGGWTALKVISANGMWRYIDLPGGNFMGAATFYPWCVTSSYLVQPSLVMIGSDDDLTPARHCQELHRTLNDKSPPMKLVVYDGARHSFDNGLPMETRTNFFFPETTYRIGHHEASFVAAQTELQAWLAELLKPMIQ